MRLDLGLRWRDSEEEKKVTGQPELLPCDESGGKMSVSPEGASRLLEAKGKLPLGEQDE